MNVMFSRPFAALFLFALCAFGDDGGRPLAVDHYVRVHSTVPAIAGQTTQIYVREVVRAGMALRDGTAADRTVLFVHGAGTPAEVAFDVPYKEYNWMQFLAGAGFADLACSSHNAMWEMNHLRLFRASLEWLTKGTLNGMEQGSVRLGY